MADCLPFEREALVEHDLTPVIHSLEDLAEMDRFARARGVRIRYHLKLDTGMGRLGTRAAAEEILDAIGKFRRMEFEGLMTHFASSADYTSPQTERQIESLRGGAGGAAPRRGRAVAGYTCRAPTRSPTGASPRGATWCGRGTSLYGYVSPAKGEAPPRILEVRPALSWKATILAVKDLPVGPWWATAARSGPSGRPASRCWPPATPMACRTACRTAGRSSPAASWCR